jgi:predicted anti-sigma-YlaC factor YlaD
LETRQAISAELDGEATEIEVAASRRHREHCDDCRRFGLAITVATAAVREPGESPQRETPVDADAAFGLLSRVERPTGVVDEPGSIPLTLDARVRHADSAQPGSKR